MGKMHSTNRVICLPQGAALPQCSPCTQPAQIPSKPVPKDWGITGGPASLETLEKNLGPVTVARNKANGETTLTFTARDPKFRIDYELKNGTRSIDNWLNDARTFVNGGQAGKYKVELQRNKDGSATYTLTLDKNVAKAAIVFGERKFLIDPEKLKTPPVKVTPVPKPQPELPLQQKPTPDPAYNPKPLQKPDPFEAKPKPTPQPKPVPKQEEKIAEAKKADPAKPRTAAEVKELERKITRTAFAKAQGAFAEDPRARFVPVPELEGLVPKTAAERDQVIEPFKIGARAHPREREQNVYFFPTRNEKGVAGMTMIPWKSVEESLSAGRFPKDLGAKQAIRGGFVTIMNGMSVDKWWGVDDVSARLLPSGVTKLEGQVNTDGSVSVRRQEEQGKRSFFNFFGKLPTKPSANATIYAPKIDENGKLTWGAVKGKAAQGERYEPAQ